MKYSALNMRKYYGHSKFLENLSILNTHWNLWLVYRYLIVDNAAKIIHETKRNTQIYINFISSLDFYV